jgi:hypothetical protein
MFRLMVVLMSVVKSGYVLGGLPCILTDNKTVFVQDDYTLIDFIDTNGGMIVHDVRFFDAYLRGYEVTVVLLDLESGELVKRKHRLNNSSLPCDWVLIDTDFLNPSKKDDLLGFCF